ncbi:hypothetical protein [Psychromicrobium xiongbiense]|uniref:hypothetical protein n=1 Tax=Psychromicrobium xiongbiense TaxID=3051184 RepID=UPI0025541389|nr:hypothetical protein [Psychromicrobium sp. YIM S02556]
MKDTDQTSRPTMRSLRAATAGGAALDLARPLSSASESAESASPSSTRAPLSLVQGNPSRSRTPFVVFCLMALMGSLAAVLVLNIAVSTGQYEIVQLRAEQTSLTKANQVLDSQLQYMQSPQNVAQQGLKAGMVAATTIGQIDIDRGILSGSPKPAAASAADAPPLIAVPTVPGTTSPTIVPGGPSKQGQPLSNFEPNAAAAGAPASGALNGGTIPSPSQKSPQH